MPAPTQKPSNPFPAWRLKYGVKNASSGELDSASESAERWGWACGGLVVLGILGEFIIAILNPTFGSFLERWAPPLCDLLIGAGVAGEIMFARIGHKFDTEFRSRSDAEVIDANERARAAEYQAELANERAASAQLETERLRALTAWRRLPDKATEEICALLSSGADSVALVLEYQRDDPEAYSLAAELLVAFTKGGIQKLRMNAESYLSGNVFGIHVNASDITSPGAGIARILDKAIPPARWQPDVDLSRHGERGQPPPNLYIFVGPRLPPKLHDIAAVSAVAESSPVTPWTR